MKFLILIIISPMMAMAKVSISNDLIDSTRNEKQESHAKVTKELNVFFSKEELTQVPRLNLPFESKVSVSRTADEDKTWKAKDTRHNKMLKKGMDRIAEEIELAQ